jgi:hypothetical protein
VTEDICIAKVGKPYRMAECGKSVHYMTSEQAMTADRGMYSGWYHMEPAADAQGHHGVPARWVR